MSELTVKELGQDECRRLLSSQRLGRLAVLVDGEPRIFPVNYRFEDDSIVFLSGRGTKLAAADLGRVSFEVDEADDDGGWSVVAEGTAFEISDAHDWPSEHLRDLPLQALGAQDPASPVRIVIRELSGRSVKRPVAKRA